MQVEGKADGVCFPKGRIQRDGEVAGGIRGLGGPKMKRVRQRTAWC